jgi:hypothetical protein
MSFNSLLVPNNYSLYFGHTQVENDNTVGTITTQDISYVSGLSSNLQNQIDNFGNPVFLTPPGDILVPDATNNIISSTDYGLPISINQPVSIDHTLTLGLLNITETLGTTGAINNTQLSYLEGLTNDLQAQIDNIGVPPTLSPHGDIVVVSGIGSTISSTDFAKPISLHQDLQIGSLTIHDNGGVGEITTTDLQYCQGLTSNLQSQINAIGTPPTLTPQGDMIVVSSTDFITSSSSYGSKVTISQNLELGPLTIHQNGGTGTTETMDLEHIQGLRSNLQNQINNIGTPPHLSPIADVVVVSSTNGLVSSQESNYPVSVNQNLTLLGSEFISNSTNNIFGSTGSDSGNGLRINNNASAQIFTVDTVNKTVSVRNTFDIYNAAGFRILEIDPFFNTLTFNNYAMNMPYAAQTLCNTSHQVQTYPATTNIPFDAVVYNSGSVVSGSSFIAQAPGLYQFSIQAKYICELVAGASYNYWLILNKNNVEYFGKFGKPKVTIDQQGPISYTGLIVWTGDIILADEDVITFDCSVGFVAGAGGAVYTNEIFMEFVKIA